jgi:surface antigen
MRHFLLSLAAIALLGIALTQPAYAGDGQLVGTLMGAGFGGLIGNQFGHGSGRVATTAAGVFVGGMVGNSLGQSADRASLYRNSYAYGSPTYAYAPVYYQSAYVPNYVAPEAPPPATYVDEESGDYCREYSQTIRVAGQVQESYGTACLQPDGSWRVVD